MREFLSRVVEIIRNYKNLKKCLVRSIPEGAEYVKGELPQVIWCFDNVASTSLVDQHPDSYRKRSQYRRCDYHAFCSEPGLTCETTFHVAVCVSDIPRPNERCTTLV